MNKNVNKSIALIVCVIGGIILLHNLYLYELNYGIVPAMKTQIESHNVADYSEIKIIESVVIVLNLLGLIGILLEYFSSKGQFRKFNFDPSDWDNYFALSMFCSFAYVLDAIIIIGLLSYLVYLII